MQYRKKPVVIEAIQYTGNNYKEICEFVGKELRKPMIQYEPFEILIETLEGNMIAKVNDFIIKGVHGEFYPCKPDIFEKSYELAE
jgi:hypothetical protein